MKTTNKEEYNEYLDKFLAKHAQDFLWHMAFSWAKNFFFNTPQGALAARLNGRTFDNICTDKKGIAFDSDYFSNISVESFGAFGHGLNVFTVDKESPYPVEKKCDVLKFNSIFLVDGKFPSNDYDKWHTFLNYDGLCAFLAMAPDKMLLDNKDFVINEIKRNASEEMGVVKIDENSAGKVDDITEKYLELSAVALTMFESANNKLLEDEEKQRKIDDEQTALENEYKETCEDNIANMAEAYAKGMDKLDEMLGIEE